uniref:Glycosyltransferase 2-like domain-containing protein n=1 Tax=Mycena chlorophos TaxID=658473 RepID=A0ABQ0LR77_MYCCL|nr:predicted protein [Mycena chlorophos]
MAYYPLPSPPTDEEKLSYLQGRRLPLYFFNLLAFTTLHGGAWLLIGSSSACYWLATPLLLVQLFNVLWFAIDFTGRDFDFEAHQETLREYQSTPAVDVYLPCCNEPLKILSNTYTYIAQLDYPNKNIFVLDDAGRPAVRALVDRLKSQFPHVPFTYLPRPASERGILGKAGNIRHAFAQTSAEFFVVFDADFSVRKDFLNEVVPVMERFPDTAIVQTPQYFRVNRDQTWVEHGAGPQVEIPFRVDQVNRNGLAATACVGSNALYRRSALGEVGGMYPIAYSEDEHTGFQMIKRGWRVRYLPLPMACGTCPDNAQVFFSQQVRWCATAPSLVTCTDFWAASLQPMQRLCWIAPLFGYVASALTPFLIPIPGLLLARGLSNGTLDPSWSWLCWLSFLPMAINILVVRKLWSRAGYGTNTIRLGVVTQFAHLMSLKDYTFGSLSGWVVSGAAASTSPDGGDLLADPDLAGESTPLIVVAPSEPKDIKYIRMRVLCAAWVYGSAVLLAWVLSNLEWPQTRDWFGISVASCAVVVQLAEVWRTWAFIWWE